MLSGPVNASMYWSQTMIRKIKIWSLRKYTVWLLLLQKCQNKQELRKDSGCRDQSAHPMALFPGGLGHGGFILLPLVPNKQFSLLIF